MRTRAASSVTSTNPLNGMKDIPCAASAQVQSLIRPERKLAPISARRGARKLTRCPSKLPSVQLPSVQLPSVQLPLVTNSKKQPGQ